MCSLWIVGAAGVVGFYIGLMLMCVLAMASRADRSA